jgi:FixJ family two-component response regulator
MTEPVLFVDDDSNLLKALQRRLETEYTIDIKTSATEALAAAGRAPYAVVVSDLRMPTMNGIDLLKKIKDLSPDTVRILLTGNADLRAAIDAVNEGNVFRFLEKPCYAELLSKTIDAGLAQYRLLRAEQDVLQETLVGTVAALVEIMKAFEPDAFGRASRLRWCVRRLARELRVRDPWQLEAAAMFSQFDVVRFVGERKRSGTELGRKLLRQVPRLHTVAEIMERRHESFRDLEGLSPEAHTIAFGAAILRASIDFDRLIGSGFTFGDALSELRRHGAEYHPEVLAALERLAPDALQADAEAAATRESGILFREYELFQPIAAEILRSLRDESELRANEI